MSNNKRTRGAGLIEIEGATEEEEEEWNTGRASDKGRLASEHRSGCAFLRPRGEGICTGHTIPCHQQRAGHACVLMALDLARLSGFTRSQLCARYTACWPLMLRALGNLPHPHSDRRSPQPRERANHWPCSDRRETPPWPILSSQGPDRPLRSHLLPITD